MNSRMYSVSNGGRFKMKQSRRLVWTTISYPAGFAGAGFTLIELIGVLAIMAILAGVMLPNVLHSIEMAAVKAEDQNLINLGEQLKLYVRQNNGTIPTTANWSAALAPYSNLALADITTNKRQMARLYVVDPGAPSQRVLLLSSMRANLPLPAAAVAALNFNGIWDAAESTVPPGFAAVWSAPATQIPFNLGFLVIERINLRPIFLSDLKTFTVTLNNTHAGSIVSYHLISGVTGLFTASNASISTAPPTVTIPVPVHPGDRLDLYTGINYGAMTYSYIFSANNVNAFTFTFQDSTPAGTPYWRAQ